MNMQSDTDTPTDNVRQFPGAGPEPQPRPKADPTSALRSKRYRRARKQGAERDGRASNSKGKRAPDGQAPQGEKQNEIPDGTTIFSLMLVLLASEGGEPSAYRPVQRRDRIA
jgi:hypothetical protein